MESAWTAPSPLSFTAKRLKKRKKEEGKRKKRQELERMEKTTWRTSRIKKQKNYGFDRTPCAFRDLDSYVRCVEMRERRRVVFRANRIIKMSIYFVSRSLELRGTIDRVPYPLSALFLIGLPLLLLPSYIPKKFNRNIIKLTYSCSLSGG